MSTQYGGVFHRSTTRIKLVIAAFVAALLAITLLQVDVAVVSFGRIIVTDRTKSVEFSRSGPIANIFVREGDYVEEGAALIQLDRVALDADLTELMVELGEASAAEARFLSLLGGPNVDLLGDAASTTADQLERHRRLLKAERQEEQNQEAVLLAQIDAATAELEVSKSHIASLEKGHPFAIERADASRVLARQEYMARFRQIDWEVQLLTVEGNLAVERSRSSFQRVQIEQARSNLSKYKADLERSRVAEAHALRQKIDRLIPQKIKIDREIDLSLIKSPASGGVYDLKVFSDKAMAVAGARVAYIVPRDAILEAELFVSAADVGFIQLGQEVSLKLDAYPFSTYGTISGQVTQISGDSFAVSSDSTLALTAEVQARLRDFRPGDATFFKVRATVGQPGLSTDEGYKKVRVGMSLQGDIMTNRRSIADFLLSPLRRYVDEALRER